MGFVRKTLSVCTLGLIDFQSDKERMARSARLTKQATRKQNRLIKKQTRRQAQQHRQSMAAPPVMARQPSVPAPLAPGWYLDSQYPGFVRWWDGARWTESMQPAPR